MDDVEIPIELKEWIMSVFPRSAIPKDILADYKYLKEDEIHALNLLEEISGRSLNYP